MKYESIIYKVCTVFRNIICFFKSVIQVGKCESKFLKCYKLKFRSISSAKFTIIIKA